MKFHEPMIQPRFDIQVHPEWTDEERWEFDKEKRIMHIHPALWWNAKCVATEIDGASRYGTNAENRTIDTSEEDL